MHRMQIQLPGDLYQKANRLCLERETPLSEVARRSLEHMIVVLNHGSKDAYVGAGSDGLSGRG